MELFKLLTPLAGNNAEGEYNGDDGGASVITDAQLDAFFPGGRRSREERRKARCGAGRELSFMENGLAVCWLGQAGRCACGGGRPRARR